MQIAQGFKNPNDFVAMMAQHNSQFKEMSDYVAANGNNYPKAFFAKAQELGLTPEYAMQIVQQKMI